MDKLIIEVAINEFASRESNPHIPYTATECAEEALRCAEAGASIVHLHARDDPRLDGVAGNGELRGDPSHRTG